MKLEIKKYAYENAIEIKIMADSYDSAIICKNILTIVHNGMALEINVHDNKTIIIACPNINADVDNSDYDRIIIIKDNNFTYTVDGDLCELINGLYSYELAH